MTNITIEEICRELNSNKQMNFIGMALTVLQANGIDAYVFDCKQKHIPLSGFVLLLEHPQTGRVLTKKSFVYVGNDIHVRDFDNCAIGKSPSLEEGCYALTSIKKNYNSRVIYVACTMVNYRWINIIEKNVPGSVVHFVILDDGGTSYSKRFKDTLQIEIYNHNNKLISSFLKVTIKILYVNALHNRLVKSHRIKERLLFEKKRIDGENRFLRNEEISECYDHIYNEISSVIPKKTVEAFDGAVVINTQCLKENNITDGIVDYELYKRLILSLKELGVKIVIKTHPRELNVEKYNDMGCIVYTDTTFSQEAIIAATKIKPVCAVSIYSATLLNFAGIFNVCVISLAKIMLREAKISATFRKQLTDYIDLYEGIVMFPESIEEALDIVFRLKK